MVSPNRAATRSRASSQEAARRRCAAAVSRPLSSSVSASAAPLEQRRPRFAGCVGIAANRAVRLRDDAAADAAIGAGGVHPVRHHEADHIGDSSPPPLEGGGWREGSRGDRFDANCAPTPPPAPSHKGRGSLLPPQTGPKTSPSRSAATSVPRRSRSKYQPASRASPHHGNADQLVLAQDQPLVHAARRRGTRCPRSSRRRGNRRPRTCRCR